MRINVSIELRRPARRSLALLAGALLLFTPAVVLASHQFTDVYDTTPFHKEIGAIAKAGITGGFAGNQYRPSEPVTRQAMAAFMERGFGRVGLAAGTETLAPSVTAPAGSGSSVYKNVRQLTITVPGASNAFSPNQLVHLRGHVEFGTAMTSAQGCPCEFTAMIVDTTTGDFGPMSRQTFESASAFAFYYSFEVEALFAAPPGPRTYRLAVAVTSRDDSIKEATFNFSWSSSLSAMTFPFGPTGGNTATAPSAQNAPADADQLPERRRNE